MSSQVSTQPIRTTTDVQSPLCNAPVPERAVVGDGYDGASPATHQLTFHARLLELQRAMRRAPKKDARLGALAGAGGGAVAGVTLGAIVTALSGVGVGAIPIGAGIGAALGAVGGATVGALMATHSHAPRPDALRLHIFSLMGVVGTRADSEIIVARMKDAGVVGRGRGRPIKDLSKLPTALDNVILSDGSKLTSEQRNRVIRILHDVQTETARRATLLADLRASCAELCSQLQSIEPTAARRFGRQIQAWGRERWSDIRSEDLPNDTVVRHLLAEIEIIKSRLLGT